MSKTDISPLTAWQQQARETPNKADLAWLDCDDCIYGRGGALFIGLHNRREDASVNLLFKRLKIVRNKAVVGGKTAVEGKAYRPSLHSLGGIYIERDISTQDHEVDDWCSASEPILEPCLYFGFRSVRVEHNNASASGGGVFATSLKNLAGFCIIGQSNVSMPHCKTDGSDGIRLLGNTIRVSTKSKCRTL